MLVWSILNELVLYKRLKQTKLVVHSRKINRKGIGEIKHTFTLTLFTVSQSPELIKYTDAIKILILIINDLLLSLLNLSLGAEIVIIFLLLVTLCEFIIIVVFILWTKLHSIVCFRTVKYVHFTFRLHKMFLGCPSVPLLNSLISGGQRSL